MPTDGEEGSCRKPRERYAQAKGGEHRLYVGGRNARLGGGAFRSPGGGSAENGRSVNHGLYPVYAQSPRSNAAYLVDALMPARR